MTEVKETIDSGSFLSLFWDLAVPEIEKREEACIKLLDYLQKDETDAQEVDFPGCSRDLVYTIKRLIKGLMSYRECSRQGFALALTYLLDNIDKIPTSSVISLMMKTYIISNETRKQEERDILFGKMFGFLALIKSQRVIKESQFLEQIIKEINLYFPSKTYLNELSIYLYKLIASQMTLDQFIHIFLPSITPLFPTIEVLETSSALLSLYIYIQYYIQSNNVSMTSINPVFTKNIFTEVYYDQYLELYKNATRNYPKIDSLFANTFSYIFNMDVTTFLIPPKEEDLNNTITSLLNTESPLRSEVTPDCDTEKRISSIHMEVLKDFFANIADKLIYSSQSAKATLFKLVACLLQCVPTSALHTVLTPSIMKCIYSTICKKDAYLKDIAIFVLKVIKCEGLKSLSRRFEIIDILMNRCNNNMDRYLHMNILSDLISCIDKDTLYKYILYIMEVFADPEKGKYNFSFGSNTLLNRETKTHSIEGEEDNMDISAEVYNDKKRLWCLEALFITSQYSILAKDSTICNVILSFFILVGYCPLISSTSTEEIQLELTSDSLYLYLTHSISIPLSINLITACRNKFNSYCSYVLTNEMKSITEKDVIVPSTFWLYKIVQLYIQLRDRFAKDFADNEDIINNNNYCYINKPIEEESTLITIVDTFIQSPKQDKNQYTLIQMLLNIYLCLLNDYEDSDILISLNDCIQCYQHLHENETDDSDDKQENPIAVLLDLCVSLLIYNNKRLREVITQVFVSIQSEITEKDLTDIVHTIMDETDDIDESESDSDESESDDDSEESEIEFNNDSDIDMEDSSEEEEEESDSESDDEWKSGLDAAQIEEMNMYDNKIVSYLNLKKDIKKDQIQNKLTNTNYKLKLLDLLDKFIENNSDSLRLLPLVNLLADAFTYYMKSNQEQLIIERLVNIYKNKLCRNKLKLDLSMNAEELHNILEECYNGLYNCILLCIKVPNNSFISHKIIEYTCYGINFYFGIINTIFDPSKSIQGNKENNIDIMRIKEMFDIPLYDYFMNTKSHIKLYFFKYITGRYPLLIHFLLMTLSQYVLKCKNLFSQYEALTIVNMILHNKYVYTQNKNSVYIQTCISYLVPVYEYIQTIINDKDNYKEMTKGIRIKALNTFVKLYDSIITSLSLTADMKSIVDSREVLDVAVKTINIQLLRTQDEDDEDESSPNKKKKEMKQIKQKNTNKENMNQNKENQVSIQSNNTSENDTTKPISMNKPVKNQKQINNQNKKQNINQNNQSENKVSESTIQSTKRIIDEETKNENEKPIKRINKTKNNKKNNSNKN